MRRFNPTCVTLALLAIVGLFLQAQPGRADGKAHEKVLPSTVWVVAKNGNGFSSGTGCLVDRERRLAVTCLHVVNDQSGATVFFPNFRQDGTVVTEAKEYLNTRFGLYARVVATDSRRDLAFLRLDSVPCEVTSVELAEHPPKPGESVYGIGNSGNVGKPLEQHSLWKQYECTFTRPVYSIQTFKNAGRPMDAWAVELDKRLSPGDSGGPLLDSQGRLIGIGYGMDEEKGYAVSADEVRLLLERLLKPLDLTGSWTARVHVKEKQPTFLKVNFLETGALEWILDGKHEGRYELHEDRLTLIVPSLNINETVTIIRRDDANFSFESAGVPFTFMRR